MEINSKNPFFNINVEIDEKAGEHLKNEIFRFYSVGGILTLTEWMNLDRITQDLFLAVRKMMAIEEQKEAADQMKTIARNAKIC